MSTKIKTTGESKIPIFVSKPLTTKFSTPLTNFSNRVRAHLSEPPKLRSNSGSGILGLLSGTASSLPRTCKKNSRKNPPSTTTSPHSPSTSPSPRPSKLFKPLIPDQFKGVFKSSPKSRSDEPSLVVGQRVVLSDGKAGVARFIGDTNFEPGVWCGVELDAPTGCNDGSVDGTEYFRCAPNSGIFVPVSSVIVEREVFGPRCLFGSGSGGGGSGGGDSRRSSDHASDLDLEEASFDLLRKVPVQSLSQISTPTPSSTNSSNIPIWEWTIGSAHSSSAGSLSQLPLRSGSGLNSASLDPHNLSFISKHSSCELDESLGILTPDQMNDFTISLDGSLQRATSFDGIETFTINSESTSKSSHPASEHSRHLNSNSETIASDVKFSEQQPSTDFNENLEDIVIDCRKNSTEENLNESLNLLDGLKDYTSTAFDDNFSCNSSKCLDLERSPSIEDLPIDAISDSKASSTTANPVSQPVAFITSVTSIASLDNGYQGDGELSRPVSRGADQSSPTAHQPIVKLKIVDPMTDSDFFTESDADIHEELQGGLGIARGDRRAQVIDGTLYGGLPTSPAKSKQSRNSHSNTEEMDSSGVYSDLDKRPECRNFGGYLPENLNETNRVVNNANLVDPSPLSNLSDLILQKVNSIQILASQQPVAMETRSETDQNTLDNTLVPDDDGHKMENEPVSGSVQKFNERNKNKVPVKNVISEVNNKKHKMPKRNVTSKIKAMIEAPKIIVDTGNEENRQPSASNPPVARQKPVGKWDAVMNKIAQNKQEQEDKLKPCRLKEVKSKVFAGINMGPAPKENQVVVGGGSNNNNNRLSANSNSQRKGQPLRNLSITQSNSTRSLTSLKSKSRRNRNRGSESNLENTIKPSDSLSRGSSHDSSLSDASDSISKSTSRSSKKVVEASSSAGSPPKKGSPASSPNQKKNATSNLEAQRNNVEPRKTPLRDQNRVANTLGQNVITSPPKSETVNGSFRRKGAQNKSPAVLSSTTTVNNNNNNNNNNITNSCKNSSITAASPPGVKTGPVSEKTRAELRHAAKAVESLSVLLQYLTCDLDGFSTPALKKELSKLKEEWLRTKLELEETQVSYRRLEDDFSSQQTENENAIKKLSEDSKSEFEQLSIKSTQDLEQLKNEHSQDIENLSKSHEEQLSELTKRLNVQASELRLQFTNELDCLHKNHEEEKEAIRKKAKEDLNAYKEERDAQMKKVMEEAEEKEKLLEERLKEIEQQHDALREQSRSIVDGMQNDKDSKVQVTSQYCRKLQDEVDSLRTVLDIRHAELQELRKQNECLQADISEMPLIRQKMVSAQARVEDLSVQLQRKALFERQLSDENRMLNESLQCESEKKQKLTYAVEELQYKLKKTQEVASHLASIKDLSSFVDSSVLTPSEAVASSTPLELKAGHKLCRNLNRDYDGKELKGKPTGTSNSKKPNTGQADEKSEPKSPKVISVVKKSDSVSWVLEMDEPSDDMVSRLVRKQSGRGLSQPNSHVSSPVRQDQVSRTEPKVRANSQSSSNKKTQKHSLRPRSLSFEDKKQTKLENYWSQNNDNSQHETNGAIEDQSYGTDYITANNWEDQEPSGQEDTSGWEKNVFADYNRFPESCKFSSREISGSSSMKLVDQDDAVNFDSDFEFFEKSEHFEIVDPEKPGIQITGGEDFASPKFSTSSLTSESSQSNLSSNHYDCENAGISLEHEEYLLINSNCKNTNKITLVNQLSPEKRKVGNSSYGDTSDDDLSSSSKYDNETDDGSSGSGSDYLEKDVSFSSHDDLPKESVESSENSKKEVLQNGAHAEIGIFKEDQKLERVQSLDKSDESKSESTVTNSKKMCGVAEPAKSSSCETSLSASRKQKSLENLAEKNSMKDKRSVSLDVSRQANACNYPSFITLEKISFINKSLESGGLNHSESFSNCDERSSKQSRYTNGIATPAKMQKHAPLANNMENGISLQHSLSVDS